jgi:hypothetical protein
MRHYTLSMHYFMLSPNLCPRRTVGPRITGERGCSCQQRCTVQLLLGCVFQLSYTCCTRYTPYDCTVWCTRDCAQFDCCAALTHSPRARAPALPQVALAVACGMSILFLLRSLLPIIMEHNQVRHPYNAATVTHPVCIYIYFY